MWTIAPPQDSYIEIPASLPLEFDRWRFSAVIRTIWKCYIPIPIFQMNFWDTNFLEIRFVRSGLTFGIIAMSLATVSGHLEKPLYHFVIRREATYVVWNNERAEILAPFQIVELANEMERTRQKKVLVILNYELEPEERENLVLIKEFARCILTDEKFYLYEIDPSRSRPVMKNTGKGDSLPGDNHFRFLQAQADRHTEP